MPEQIAYSPDETARVLGICRATVYELVRKGVLVPFKIGRSTKFNAHAVRALVGEGNHEARR